MSRRFLVTLLTIIIVAVAAGVAIFVAKGYRFSTNDRTIVGTGIMSITSVPDQASVYLDGNLTTATNANVNSLPPKTYQVKIVKEGFITWEKKIEVRAGLVSEIKATLFRAIPSVYPLTYSGVLNPLLSPDGQKLVYIVPAPTDANLSNNKKSGIWVWQLSDRPVTFARGGEPHQISLYDPSIDYSQAKFRFSPNSRQVLVSVSDKHFLLETDKLNDPPKNITATVNPTIQGWDEDQKNKDLTRLATIKDLELRKIASSTAVLKWSPDETKILLCQNDCQDKPNFKIYDLDNAKNYQIPKADFYNWLPNSKHLVLVESQKSDKIEVSVKEKVDKVPVSKIVPAKISVVEYDGLNKSELYVGNFDPASVFTWFDSSRLVMVSSLPTATASQPNFFGINLK